ncbi:hypothetical protein BCR34DRAFT_569465 [Clohesyomyces aquaticus]|uniref:Uncharacterized protein n=1 Tax=Clohesyomyces aquaticus TaxID=1231657 RepID=A0A1Y1ZEU8_9PLEO|nr:hypothetical protein BCR34DRAFT_569465 [Clohesyomyces aquaticus]
MTFLCSPLTRNELVLSAVSRPTNKLGLLRPTHLLTRLDMSQGCAEHRSTADAKNESRPFHVFVNTNYIMPIAAQSEPLQFPITPMLFRSPFSPRPTALVCIRSHANCVQPHRLLGSKGIDLDRASLNIVSYFGWIFLLGTYRLTLPQELQVLLPSAAAAAPHFGQFSLWLLTSSKVDCILNSRFGPL